MGSRWAHTVHLDHILMYCAHSYCAPRTYEMSQPVDSDCISCPTIPGNDLRLPILTCESIPQSPGSSADVPTQGPNLARLYHVAPQPQQSTATSFLLNHGNTCTQFFFAKIGFLCFCNNLTPSNELSHQIQKMSQATSNSEKEPSLEAAIPSETEEEGALLVDWEGSDDEANPCNWPSRKRWAHIIIVAILGLIP